MSKTKQQYQQDTNRPNNKSFKSILNDTKKFTSSRHFKVLNKHWNINYTGVSANNTNYNNPLGA